ncbi:MAG TPA: hypothetical protein PKE69_05410 [Pyrinomonadaceae bacterium]|nr:hypothetical protein [Pyrinomonadaceae bacterium]
MNKSYILAVSIILIFSQNLLAQKTSDDNPKAKLIESYTAFKSDEASMIIDKLRMEVNQSANSKGVIIVYCGKICKYGEVEAHLRGISFSLKSKGVNLKQFVIISGGFREKTTTEFWLVPENACFPMPNSSVEYENVTFKGKFKEKIYDYECCFH